MKLILFSFLLIALLASCESNNKRAVNDSIAVTPKADNAQQLIAEFKPFIQGVWVKSDYVYKVLATKSPLAAADLANGMTTMSIDTQKISGDSIMVEAGWNNHEGSEMALKFKPGRRKSTIQFGAGDLGYSIQNGDTILTTYWPDDNKKIVATNYKRALHKQSENLGDGTDLLFNKGLIAGSYLFTDSTGTISKVKFEVTGGLSGFFAFKKYSINIDLNSDVMDNLDEINFEDGLKNNRPYSFKIIGDTLKLYDTRPDKDSTLLLLDRLRYKLIRQH